MTNSAMVSALQTGTAVAIVIDTSGSMEGARLAGAKRAFAEIICAVDQLMSFNRTPYYQRLRWM